MTCTAVLAGDGPIRCVSAEEAAAAYAVPDLPDWMTAARGPFEEDVERLRAIG